MIDTHAHLDACHEPADVLLARARVAGVTTVITIGAGIDSCRRALAIVDREQAVVAALGIDPHHAAPPESSRLAELRELLDHPRVVAVGETGLDHHWGADTKDEQQRLFAAQLELAEELDMPVVVHCREAAEETAAALGAFRGTVVLHCFSEPALLEHALERRYYVSFAGNLTYPRSAELRELAARVPADRLLVETDTPYLAPQPRRGRPNEPANLVHTVSVLAEARGEALDELAGTLDANAAAAFGL